MVWGSRSRAPAAQTLVQQNSRWTEPRASVAQVLGIIESRAPVAQAKATAVESLGPWCPGPLCHRSKPWAQLPRLRDSSRERRQCAGPAALGPEAQARGLELRPSLGPQTQARSQGSCYLGLSVSGRLFSFCAKRTRPSPGPQEPIRFLGPQEPALPPRAARGRPHLRALRNFLLCGRKNPASFTGRRKLSASKTRPPPWVARARLPHSSAFIQAPKAPGPLRRPQTTALLRPLLA